MNYISANNEYHVPLHVKPIRLKKGGVSNGIVSLKIRIERIEVYSL